LFCEHQWKAGNRHAWVSPRFEKAGVLYYAMRGGAPARVLTC
jgi:hypothetical protein